LGAVHDGIKVCQQGEPRKITDAKTRRALVSLPNPVEIRRPSPFRNPRHTRLCMLTSVFPEFAFFGGCSSLCRGLFSTNKGIQHFMVRGVRRISGAFQYHYLDMLRVLCACELVSFFEFCVPCFLPPGDPCGPVDQSSARFGLFYCSWLSYLGWYTTPISLEEVAVSVYLGGDPFCCRVFLVFAVCLCELRLMLHRDIVGVRLGYTDASGRGVPD